MSVGFQLLITVPNKGVNSTAVLHTVCSCPKRQGLLKNNHDNQLGRGTFVSTQKHPSIHTSTAAGVTQGFDYSSPPTNVISGVHTKCVTQKVSMKMIFSHLAWVKLEKAQNLPLKEEIVIIFHLIAFGWNSGQLHCKNNIHMCCSLHLIFTCLTFLKPMEPYDLDIYSWKHCFNTNPL